MWEPLLPRNCEEWVRKNSAEFTIQLIRLAETQKWTMGIDQGAGALILYFQTAGDFFQNPRFVDFSRTLLLRMRTEMPNTDLTFYGGRAGLLWLQSMMGEQGSSRQQTAQWQKLADGYLGERNIDLVSGLSGLGVSLLQNKVSQKQRKFIVTQIFNRLVDARPEQMAWPATSRRGKVLDQNAKPFFDLGLAHGQAGPLSLLGYLYQQSPESFSPSQVQKVQQVVNFLLHQDHVSGFGFYTRDPKSVQSRSAWCYGDPGVGFALINAGQSFGEPKWKQEGIRIALRGLKKDPFVGQVYGPFVCHGSIGLAHLSARLFARTRDKRFKTLARRWYGIAIEQYQNLSEEKKRKRGQSLLVDSLGFFKFAMAACLAKDPAWDSFMMLSCPGEKN